MDEFEINFQDYAIENENTWSFRAIKMGDVNCNAEVDFPFTGGEDQYILTVPQHDCLEASETAILYLIGKSSDNISAYQLGFTFDEAAMEIQGISKGDLPSFYFGNSQLSEENYPAGISSCVLQNVSNLQGGVIYYIVHLGDEIHTGNLVKVE